MIMVLNRVGRTNKIGRRLILLIVAFSSLLTFFITALQLFVEYRQQRADMDNLLEQVRIFLPPIAASVWSFDERQIGLALDAVVHLPHVERAAITTADGKTVWTASSGTSSRLLTRDYPLSYEVRGQPQQIATMAVDASLDGIYARVLSQAVTILISNGVKTFLVAAFMLVIFNRLVTVRLKQLAQSVGGLFPQELLQQASVCEDYPPLPDHGDEIDALRLAFDNMARRLRTAVQDLHDGNRALHAENAERRRVEDELQRLIKELSRANVELERFAYVAVHDLQEPIRALVSFSQLLERKYAEILAGEGTEFIGFIVAAAKRLSSLVTDLLEYRLEGGANLNAREVDCQQLVAGAAESLHQLIEQKQARLVIGPMPRLVADPVQLHHVFHNLIGNALTFSRDGIIPEIHVEAVHEEGGWQFEVRDNGIGIEEQYSGYVFEVFRRLHSRTDFPGTGIGLAICKRIVEDHGGCIWLRSIPGEGTSFFFTIPDAPAA
ncbi:MAG: two-component sensor histidine kinase [Rhodospirillaceae bacterium]|nr:two-component sensor histidine kinase [Rhodospirillales bacterium]